MNRSIRRPLRGVAAALCAVVLASCAADGTLSPSSGAPVEARQPQGARWSDPTTWPNGTVPVAGQDVTIPDSTTIVLDVVTPPLGAVTIRGNLVAGDGAVGITAGRIDVYGSFSAGSEAQPYTSRLTVTLRERPDDTGGDTKGVVVHPGGQLELHGRQRVLWTHLAADAAAGSRQLRLADSVDWVAGDRIVVAPSGFNYAEAELLTVTSATGGTVTIAQSLAHAHSGTIRQVAGASVDERAEVGLLTHDILIQGDAASEQNGHGGHVIVYRGGSAHVEGIELYRMGQRGHLGRYPFHWHMDGSVAGQYIRSSSVWHTFNRCATVHGTMDAMVENNVCYDHEGHGYFVEDGNETGNTFRHDLATFARPGSILPSDDAPANFWISNPDNTFEDNAAAGSPAVGFWISPPLHPTGPSATDAIWPAFTPLRRFDHNVAHSVGDGIHAEQDHREEAPGFDAAYHPRTGSTPDGAPALVVYSHYTAYADNRALWTRGDHQRIDQSVLADNRIGVMMGDASLGVEGSVTNSLVVGRSGNPLADPGERTSGVLLYDGPIAVSGVTFANFATAPQDAAFGGQNGLWVRVSPRYSAERVTLVDARPVYLPSTLDDSYGFGSVRDIDGSLTGRAGAVAIPKLAFLGDQSCGTSADWNAAVCSAPYVSVGIRGAYDLSSTVISKDGTPLHTWTGTSGPDLSITVPANHTYEFAPPKLDTTYHFEVDGLSSAPAGTSVTVVGPWSGSTVRIVANGLGTTAPLPIVSSLAALGASPLSAGYVDTAAAKLYVRVVGAVDPMVELFPSR